MLTLGPTVSTMSAFSRDVWRPWDAYEKGKFGDRVHDTHDPLRKSHHMLLTSPNYVYLVPYSTLLFLYSMVLVAATSIAFTMRTMVCKASGDGANPQRLKVASV